MVDKIVTKARVLIRRLRRAKDFIVRDNVIIVHQMGKVGSSSVYKSLELAFSRPVFHTHFLNEKRLTDYKEYLKRNNLKLKGHVVDSIYLHKKVFSQPSLQKELYVIALTREPIGRNISAFFNNLDRYVQADKIEHARNNPDSQAEIIRTFIEEYHHNIPLSWFQDEIAAVFDIDVYENPFDFDKKYQILRKGKVNLLIIRMEDLNEVFSEAIKTFVGSKKRILLNDHNVGQKKSYSNQYSDFLASIKLPPTYINEMLTSKYTTHFYSPSEIEHLKKKWSK